MEPNKGLTTMEKNSNKLIAVGAIMAAIAVMLGAFGAHIVQDSVSPERFENWKTGAQYHFYHAIAVIITGILARYVNSVWLTYAGVAFAVGIILFSFSLYTLSVTGITILGAITPLGGVSFIIGWAILAKVFFTPSNKPNN